MQKTEEAIAKYAVDANLFWLGSTNPKKNTQPLDVFWCPYGKLSHGKLSHGRLSHGNLSQGKKSHSEIS